MRHLINVFVLVVTFTASAFAQSWTAPRTWVAAETVTASIMNTHVRDNLSVLRAGGFAVTSQATGDLLCASSSTQFARLDGSHAVGQLLASNGAGACPVFTASPSVTSISLGTNPAAAGAVRLANNQAIAARNLTNTGDVSIVYVDNSQNAVRFSGDGFPSTFGASVYINDTHPNANATTGLTINQGTADDELFSGKSSDVAHLMTSVTEEDTFVLGKKYSAGAGGVLWRGLREDAAAAAWGIYGSITGAGDTTKTTTSQAIVEIDGTERSGGTITTASANANLFRVSTNGTAKFIVDTEGEYHSDGGAGTTFDAFDDPMLALTWEATTSRKPHMLDLMTAHSPYTKDDLVAAGIVAADGPNGERGMVNQSALTRLAVGGLWQLRLQIQEQAIQIRQLSERLATVEQAPAQVVVAR